MCSVALFTLECNMVQVVSGQGYNRSVQPKRCKGGYHKKEEECKRYVVMHESGNHPNSIPDRSLPVLNSPLPSNDGKPQSLWPISFSTAMSTRARTPSMPTSPASTIQQSSSSASGSSRLLNWLFTIPSFM